MASSISRPHNEGSGQPSFLLSPHQQDLLFAALNSNSSIMDTNQSQRKAPNTVPYSDSSVTATTDQHRGSIDAFETPLVDYEYDFDNDQSFDFDFPTEDHMIGNLPGTSSDGDSTENHEKRSHPEDDDDEEDGGGKRREGDEKGAKKAGRKPLTNEPTSKRKAQNRAAQRAFRERKERHLKDLETKVEDLQKASESANHENAMLRAKMEQMAAQLKEYKKRPLPSTDSNPVVPAYLAGSNGNTVNNLNDVNFQFEFPQFGKLPGPPITNLSESMAKSASTSRPSVEERGDSNNSRSPPEQLMQSHHYGSGNSNTGIIHDFSNNMSSFGPISNDDLAGLFSPSILENSPKDTNNSSNLSRTGSESTHQYSTGHSTTYSSPSDSDHSGFNNGLTSSCGTSPEPLGHSPLNKADKQLPAIAEQRTGDDVIQGEKTFCSRLGQACGTSSNPIPRTMSISDPISTGQVQGSNSFTPGFEMNNFDWSFETNSQNGFDPQLYGDYRESQDAILAGHGLYDDGFFNEAIDMNQFGSPFNLGTTPQPQPIKKDLVSEIDERLNAEDEVVPAEGKMLTCNNMWEKIQNCPSVQNGEIDMDQLCSQLQQKAKCSGDGPVINEQDFKSVIRSMFPADQPCPTSKQS